MSRDTPIRPDLLIANFEGPDYGDWTTTGEGFGDRPWRRTDDRPLNYGERRYILGQEGRGLAASVFRDGVTAMGTPTGTLSSPEFTIERDYINLLMGGGWYPGRTCVDLVIDGAVVCSDTGNGCGYGAHQGNYLLEWFTWDVRAYSGRSARIRLVDDFDFPTACILVDRIVQSDLRKAERVDLTPYRETYRPQFHFTADKGWINDPCGLFLYDGTYHLCFQHTSYDEIESALFSPVVWGHAVSDDLVHWRQMPDAIRCEESFHWPEYSCLAVASVEGKPSGFIMSGSSIVDVDNDAGFQRGDHLAIRVSTPIPAMRCAGSAWRTASTEGGRGRSTPTIRCCPVRVRPTAIPGCSSTKANGTWRFRTPGGLTWNDLDSPSTSTHRTRSPGGPTWVRFLPRSISANVRICFRRRWMATSVT